MNALGMAIAWCALQITLFLVPAALVYWVMRRLHPTAGAWCAAASLVLVLGLSALATSPWPQWRVEPLLERPTRDVDAAGGHPASAPRAKKPVAAKITGEVVAPSDSSWLVDALNLLQFSPSAPIQTDSSTTLRWPLLIATASVAGIGIGLVRLAGGLAAVRRLVQRSRPIAPGRATADLARLQRLLQVTAPVPLRESAEIGTPATIGSRRPVILLPAAWRSWTAAELESVLAHELAHVARKDFASWLAARLATALHFYHPLVHWFAQRLQLDQELSADAAAVSAIGNRTAYLHALANLALSAPAHGFAGPARTFIPSRSLLLRRVEMLKSHEASTPASPYRAWAAGWSSLAMLSALAITVAGLRQSTNAAQPAVAAPQQVAESTTSAPADETSAYNFSYVPDDFTFLVAMRPAQMAASPRLKALADLFDQISRPRIPARQLDQITFVLPAPDLDDRGNVIPGSGSEYTVLRTNEPVDFKPFLRDAYVTISAQQVNGREILTWSEIEGRIAFFVANDRTLVSHPKAGLVKVANDPDAAAPPAASAQWNAEASGPLFATVNVGAIRGMMGAAPTGVVQQIVGPMLDATERLVVTVDDAEPLVIRATATCRTAQDAKIVEQTLRSALLIGRNIVAGQKAAQVASAAGNTPQEALQRQQATAVYDIAIGVLDSVDFATEGRTLTFTAHIDDPATVIGTALAPAMLASREAAARTQSMNNLKRLGLAVHVYAQSVRSMPPAVVHGQSFRPELNPTGANAANVPRSWRVELLPALGYEELYRQYRLDQPWDSEANLKVLAQIPDVFRAPEDAPGSTNASYFALTGPDTVFDGREGTKFTDITDGMAHTLMFVEARRPVPWTKPEDIVYEPAGALPQFGGWRPQSFVAVFCDGSVAVISAQGDETLRELIEKADGQAVEMPWVPDQAVLPVQPANAPPPRR